MENLRIIFEGDSKLKGVRICWRTGLEFIMILTNWRQTLKKWDVSQ